MAPDDLKNEVLGYMKLLNPRANYHRICILQLSLLFPLFTLELSDWCYHQLPRLLVHKSHIPRAPGQECEQPFQIFLGQCIALNPAQLCHECVCEVHIRISNTCDQGYALWGRSYLFLNRVHVVDTGHLQFSYGLNVSDRPKLQNAKVQAVRLQLICCQMA